MLSTQPGDFIIRINFIHPNVAKINNRIIHAHCKELEMYCLTILPEYPRCFINKFIHALEKRGNVKKPRQVIANIPANRHKFRFQSRFHAFLLALT